MNKNTTLLTKDAALNSLGDKGNVAQFVSFGPDLKQRFARVQNFEPNHLFGGLTEAVEAVLKASVEQSVNVRSFDPSDPKSRPFIYGIKSVAEAVAAVERLAGEGLHTIVNETVDIHDGGVSGVMIGDLIEFAPDDIPRCVEKAGTVSFTREMGLRVLQTVYGFLPNLNFPPDTRVEFSLHPLPRGYKRDNILIWELEHVGEHQLAGDTHWPNNFSRFLGDKAFGLLVADAVGLTVPTTLVVSRRVAPFNFGEYVGTNETWIRTCPAVQEPGRFTTQRGWCDPFKLMAKEDPEGTSIASVLAQEGIDAVYSGSLVVEADGNVLIEGTAGYGDKFMVGSKGAEEIPYHVKHAVREQFEIATKSLGPVRMEWVYDRNDEVWTVQLHRGSTTSQGSTIYPGEASSFVKFDVTTGLDALRQLISQVAGTGKGIALVGNVGITSHFGDVLRKAQIPSLLERV